MTTAEWPPFTAMHRAPKAYPPIYDRRIRRSAGHHRGITPKIFELFKNLFCPSTRWTGSACASIHRHISDIGRIVTDI